MTAGAVGADRKDGANAPTVVACIVAARGKTRAGATVNVSKEDDGDDIWAIV